jgi:hypothetical protein
MKYYLTSQNKLFYYIYFFHLFSMKCIQLFYLALKRHNPEYDARVRDLQLIT